MEPSGEGQKLLFIIICWHTTRAVYPVWDLGPFTQEREHMDMRNNVFYNWAGNGCYGGEGMYINIVNNYYNQGPATPKTALSAISIAAIGVRTKKYCTNADGTPNAWKPMEHVWGKLYVDGNVIEGNEEVTQDNWTKGIYGQINNASCDNTFTKKVKKEMRLSEPLVHVLSLLIVQNKLMNSYWTKPDAPGNGCH